MKTEAKTAVAKATPPEELAVAKTGGSPLGLQTFDVTGEDLPDLDTADTLPINLSSEYWTPAPLGTGQKEGEAKRLFFSHIENREVVDEATGAINLLPTAFFLEKKNNAIVTVCNSSKRLVGTIENNKIQRGTPLLVTYMGKQKNKNNAFFSDFWSIKPLVVKI